MTNKNLHVTTPKKGSKMTKKRGSKKGQKWPKMGVQKRVKKRPKIKFSRFQKMDEAYNETMTNKKKINKHNKQQTCKKKNQMIVTKKYP
jgi:hypothetical protein